MSIFLINPYIYQVTDTPVEQIANAEAMSFDGTSQFINTNASLTGSDFTLSYWVNADGVYSAWSYHAPVTMRPSNNQPNQSIGIFYTKSSNLYPLLQANDSTDANYSSYTAEGLGSFSGLGWKHIVYTYDNTTRQVYLYVNGVQQNWTNFGGTSTTPYLILLSTITGYSELWIGATYSPANYFGGKIDEVALFNTKLSASKIQQIYDATAVVNGVPQTANLFTGGLSSSLVYWNRMGDS